MKNTQEPSKVGLLDNYELQPLIKVHQKYRKARLCIGSKAAVAVLSGAIAESIVYILLRDKHTVAKVLLENYSIAILSIAISGYGALLQFFYPLAGYMADTKTGRYKMVHYSLWILNFTILCLGIAGILAYYRNNHTIKNVYTGVFYLAYLMSLIGLPGFNANVIQFGLDQLFHTPSEDQSLFIQWYVWTYYVSGITVDIAQISETVVNSKVIHFTLLAVPFLIITTLLLISWYLFYRQRKWFLIVSKYKNPYSLVYKVTKFSRIHKVPLKRSAFTYCEDDIPCGLDLGKEKYGGPFTTEQVEDVKAFYGVLKIICALGPVLLIHAAASHTISLFPRHLEELEHNGTAFTPNSNTSLITTNYIIANGTVYTVTVFIMIPLFICVVRPLVRDWIPGMLRRIGIGISVSVLSIILSLAVDASIHLQNAKAGCIFTSPSFHNITVSHEEHTQIPAQVLLIVQQILSAISHTVFYVAVYEFICSQSPQSMKGFLLGLLFASRGLYEILGSLIMLPFVLNEYPFLLPSCGMVYYLVNIAIGVAALILYIYTARNYKFRTRDEVCPVRRHVEEYYSKMPKKTSAMNKLL